VDDVKTSRREIKAREVRQLRISVVAGPDAGATFVVAGGAAIGSAPDNKVVLRDPEVSRYHLELEPGDAGVVLRDLGSLNGTFVGPLRLHGAVVPPSTRVTVGSTTIVIDDAGVAPLGAGFNAEVPSIVGISAAIRDVASQCAQLATSQVSVLIQGETGTGKELVAHAIHELGPRRDRPFVVIDCGSLPATLIASELFGHERGAFTGADQRHVGAFEQADGGTLFLDEIGELPLAVQPALLGVLERKRFRRVGGQKELHVDVRVVAATNRDLRAEANRATFRPDLYFRLGVARIVVPPLRERREDIEPLVAHFVEQTTGSRDVARYFGPTTLDALRAHPWTGNVRELRNVVERALAMGEVRFDSGAHQAIPPGGELGTYRDARARAIATFERDYFTRLLAACGNNASEAARRASMDRPYLLGLLKRHKLR
jgi:DNA-binding NtrC family response regulator